MSRRRLVAALMVLVVGVAAGCVRPREPEKPAPGGTLTIGLLKAPAGVFRPLVNEERDSAPVAQALYSGLLRPGPKLELVCDLCVDFGVSADRRTITFHLRQNVQWHDGKPFTSADVAHTYLTMLGPGYAGAQTGKLAALAGVQALLDERDAIDRDVAAGKLSVAQGASRKAAGWERWLKGPGQQAVAAADPHTVSFTTDVPYAPLLAALLLPIAPAHTREPVGTGPFKLVEFKRGEQVTLSRHDAYHMGRPHVETLVFRVVKPGTALEMLRAGTADYVPLSAEEASQVKAGEPLQAVVWPAPGYQYLGVNHTRPPFSDLRVRQALMHGINRKGLVQTLLHGRGTVTNTHVLAGHWSDLPEGLNQYPYDPAEAAALLSEAGWSALDSEGYRVRDGRRLQFVLKYPRGNPAREASAALIQRDLKAIGVKADLQMLEFGALVREVFGQREADAWLLGWDLGVDPDPGPVFSPDNRWGQASGWYSDRSDELLRRGRLAVSTADRRPLYAEWMKLVNAELPYLFLYAESDLAGLRSDRIRGTAPDVRGALWNIWEWWIPKERQ